LLLEPQPALSVGSPSFERDHDHFFGVGQDIYGCFNAGGLLCPIIHDGSADPCRPRREAKVDAEAPVVSYITALSFQRLTCFASLLLNRHKICIELGYVSYLYHGPAQQQLAGGVWHVLAQLRHFCYNVQRLTVKLQLLAAEANKLHIMVLEVRHLDVDLTEQSLLLHRRLSMVRWHLVLRGRLH
jgi:hypothetical protein